MNVSIANFEQTVLHLRFNSLNRTKQAHISWVLPFSPILPQLIFLLFKCNILATFKTFFLLKSLMRDGNNLNEHAYFHLVLHLTN